MSKDFALRVLRLCKLEGCIRFDSGQTRTVRHRFERRRCRGHRFRSQRHATYFQHRIGGQAISSRRWFLNYR